jgi:NAD-dependent deacetylase
MKKKLVVLTGAGISKESGIPTFRDSDGLWENHSIMDVATPQGWEKNPKLVLKFYNDRRKHLATCEPNDAHKILAELEKDFDVHIITQNIDDLHEKGGSTKIIHLHGELTKARNLSNDTIVDIGYDDIEEIDNLRPHVVWFGENTLNLNTARNIVAEAQIFVVIGTSLQVYPAAGLVDYVPHNTPIWLVDPNNVSVPVARKVQTIHEVASKGTRILMEKLKEI